MKQIDLAHFTQSLQSNSQSSQSALRWSSSVWAIFLDLCLDDLRRPQNSENNNSFFKRESKHRLRFYYAVARISLRAWRYLRDLRVNHRDIAHFTQILGLRRIAEARRVFRRAPSGGVQASALLCCVRLSYNKVALFLITSYFNQ